MDLIFGKGIQSLKSKSYEQLGGGSNWVMLFLFKD